MAAADTTTLDNLRPQRAGGLGLGAVLAILAHVLLVLGLAFGVNWRSSEPEGVTAELWSATPQIAAPAPVEPAQPRPEPKPEPTPPPPPKAEPTPPQQRDADIAIEKAKKEREREKQRAEEEERQERQRKEREKAEQLAKDKAEKEKADREQARKEQADKLAKEKAAKAAEAAIAKQREENLKRMMGQAGATGAPNATGTAATTSGPSASYGGRVRAQVKPRIEINIDSIPGNPAAEVEVRSAPDGTILSRTLRKSSGVPAWDDAVLRAIDKTAVLPRDTDGRVPSPMTIVFRPRD